jgi:hypothetical protein
MLRSRHGLSAIELLIVVVLSAIVLGLLGAVSARQQRFSRDVALAVERSEEVNRTAEMLPIALRGVSPADGDIASASARDTSLEFRALIVTAIVCDTNRGRLLLSGSSGLAPSLTSILTQPEAGDTVWTLSATGGDVWTAHRILVVSDSTYACRIGGVAQWGGLRAPSLVIGIAGAAVSPGSPVRVMRPWRYSLYRSSDGYWYVGGKDWNTASAKFNTIQPVSGPFLSAAAKGLVFRYFDSTHAQVASGTPDTRSIALIEVALRVDSTLPGTFAHAVSAPRSVVTSVGLRNR